MFNFIRTLPSSTPNVLAVILFAIIIFISWKMPKEYIYKGIEGEKDSKLHDLRIWATVLLLLQSILYFIF
jgi:hypothetical protein